MFLRLLPIVGASIAAVWLATLIAVPRKPLPDNEVQELVYSRLLGRQQRVILFAMMVTALGLLALILSMASNVAALSNRTPPRRQICFNNGISPPTCYTPQPGGAWVEETLQADGTWRVVGVTFTAPHAPGEKDDPP